MTLYSLDSRPLWGDFGKLLICGLAERDQGGILELRRTGPFAPPISILNWLNTIVVTAAFRKEVSESFPFLPAFRQVKLLHVPEFRWEHWDRTKDLPCDHLPPMREIEDLIDGQPHSNIAASEIGALWECKAQPLAGARTELIQRHYGDTDCDVRLLTSRIPDGDFFGGYAPAERIVRVRHPG
jgi:hypothetical protein